ncbi:transporter [bacterium 1XD42-8]|nr:transporter [Lachnospiraceae bacterium]RKJ36760.1 transporter [bacterium 1XD42-8]
MEKNSFKNKLNDVIFVVAHYFEILISIIVIGVILYLMWDLVISLLGGSLSSITPQSFNSFLASALNLVIGIEFVKMLCKHTPETLIEVLMFATAREMVVEHLKTYETLIGILAIALLFAIRKYLFIKKEDSSILSDKF